MKKHIINFPTQFSYNPKIFNYSKISNKKFDRYIVGGMGGSGLAPYILSKETKHNILVARDYQIYQKITPSTLYIANSFSGNTVEVITQLNTVIKKNIPSLVITTGGKILEIAKKHQIPYIKLPNPKITPRMALGYNIKALLKAMDDEIELYKISALRSLLNPLVLEETGKKIAEKIFKKVPVIYTTERNSFLSYIWKIKFNENSKIPAFASVIPESNHNELEGWGDGFQQLNFQDNFFVLFIKDNKDYIENKKRIKVLAKIMKSKKIDCYDINIKNKNRWEGIFNNIILSDWSSYHLADLYQINPERTKTIDDFKEKIS